MNTGAPTAPTVVKMGIHASTTVWFAIDAVEAAVDQGGWWSAPRVRGAQKETLTHLLSITGNFV